MINSFIAIPNKASNRAKDLTYEINQFLISEHVRKPFRSWNFVTADTFTECQTKIRNLYGMIPPYIMFKETGYNCEQTIWEASQILKRSKDPVFTPLGSVIVCYVVYADMKEQIPAEQSF